MEIRVSLNKGPEAKLGPKMLRRLKDKIRNEYNSGLVKVWTQSYRGKAEGVWTCAEEG